MSLTGAPLIAGAVVCALVALAGTVVVWNRWGSWRLLTRPLGVLLTEALVLLSVGLVVNRSEEFYPTLQSLFEAGYTGGRSYATTPGALDATLNAEPGADGGQSVTFTWRQAGWSDWGLTAPPSVVVPAGYLTHKGLRYPLIVVLDGATVAGTPGAGEASQAVVVYAHPAATAKPAGLAAGLAGAMPAALRVTPYRWAVVTDPARAALGAGVVAAAPTHYSALAVLCTTVPQSKKPPVSSQNPVAAGKNPAAAGKNPAVTGKTPAPAGKKPAVAAQKTTTTGKSAATSKRPSAASKNAAAAGKKATAGSKNAACAQPALPAGIMRTVIAAGAGGVAGLPAALSWAAGELPPPLAASTPPPRYLPPGKRHPHPGASGAARPPRQRTFPGIPKKAAPGAPSAALTGASPAALTGVASTAAFAGAPSAASADGPSAALMGALPAALTGVASTAAFAGAPNAAFAGAPSAAFAGAPSAAFAGAPSAAFAGAPSAASAGASIAVLTGGLTAAFAGGVIAVFGGGCDVVWTARSRHVAG